MFEEPQIVVPPAVEGIEIIFEVVAITAIAVALLWGLYAQHMRNCETGEHGPVDS
jgi:hypothetical protein